MIDIYGYKKDVKPVGELASSQHATLNLGAGKIGLVQGVRWAYTHQIQPRYESGSATVYWQQGTSVGQIDIEKLVGKSGFMSAFKPFISGACSGTLRPINIGLDGSGGCASVSFGAGGLTLDGVVATSVGGSWNVQNSDVSENLSALVASIS